MTTTKFNVKYEAGHSYDETWAPNPDYFCPSCGVKGQIWTEQNAGDYYLGPESLCLACGTSHLLDGCGDSPSTSWQGRQRLTALREAEKRR